MWEFADRKESDSAALIVWSSICLTVLRLSVETANRIILWHIYGYRTVAYYHLSITRVKPQLVASNGDILKGWGFFHYLIGISIWIPVSVIVLMFVFKYLAPGWQTSQLKNGGTIRPGYSGVLALLIMFFCIPGLLPLVPAIAIGLTAAVGGVFWLRSATAKNA